VARPMPSDLGVVQNGSLEADRITPGGAGVVYSHVATVRKRVDCFDLRPFPGQPAARYAPAELASLRESIATLGLLMPPLIWRNDTGHVVLAGFRRARCWQLLALDGLVPRKMDVNICTGITERDARRLVIAEESHREEEYPVAKAERIGAEWLALSDELGRDATMEEMAAVLKPQKTAISESLLIYRALQDARLEPLVRSADGAGKALLVKALRLDDFSRRVAALQAYQQGGRSAMATMLSPRTGRPRKPVTKHPQGGGYDLTVRFRKTMSRVEAAAAQSALTDTLRDIESLLGTDE
jgi:ParB-like chromosome segregation protein Spo0J